MIDSNKIKSKQVMTGAFILLLVGLIAVIVTFIMSDKKNVNENQQESPKAERSEGHFESAIANVDTAHVKNEQIQNKLTETEKKVEEATTQFKNTATTQDNKWQEHERVMQDLMQKLNVLEQSLSDLQTKITTMPAGTPQSTFENRTLEGQTILPSQGIREDNFLSNNEDIQRIPIKNPKTYVPSGTFVKAVMIGGADAPASATSQANPKPMIFKIVERGTLPNNHKSHLKSCTVTAAVAGDISSERGEIRLETLSCVKKDGQILDVPVEGTVFGHDGKNGVRGNSLFREGALLQRAAGAGLLSGFSDAITQRYTTTSISPLGSTQSVDGNQFLQYGAAKGASSAMNKLAEYYIQRAEQYHPVIQLSAGSVVDIVFLKGFFIDGKSHNENENDYLATTKNTNESQELAPLPLTEKQVMRLKEHQKQLGLQPQDVRVNNETKY
ncbi:MAG: hypothetical protein LEGION0398_MBIBDBAK_00176 [Legionellaceae bacterium]